MNELSKEDRKFIIDNWSQIKRIIPNSSEFLAYRVIRKMWKASSTDVRVALGVTGEHSRRLLADLMSKGWITSGVGESMAGKKGIIYQIKKV